VIARAEAAIFRCRADANARYDLFPFLRVQPRICATFDASRVAKNSCFGPRQSHGRLLLDIESNFFPSRI